MFDRRQILLGGAAALGACAHAEAGITPDAAADAQFRDAVDRMGQRSRRTRAFLLRRFDVHRLTSNGRVLYETLLPGADADAALTRRAWGKNGAPYPVTHRNGNWRRAVELREDDRPRWSA